MANKFARRTEFRVTDALRILPPPPSSSAARPIMPLATFCFEASLATVNGTAGNATASTNPEIVRLRLTFRIIMVSISVIGVAGNVLNLLTLRSPSLRTVPFRYIRALAVYDLISLTAILVHFLLDIMRFEGGPIIYYKVWVEDVVINSFLVAGLYVAVLLTIERYLLIRKPLKSGRLLSIENTTNIKIAMALLASLLLHLPMTLQNTVKRDPGTGRLVKGNNQRLLCREPYWTIFNYYKMLREFLRFFCVVLLMSLNIIIAKSLQIAKKNRRMLIKRSSQPDLSYSGTDIMSVSYANPTHNYHHIHQQQQQNSSQAAAKNGSAAKRGSNGSGCDISPAPAAAASVVNSVRNKWKQRRQRRRASADSGGGGAGGKASAHNSLSSTPAAAATTAALPLKEKANKRDLSLLKSFTEKKLTVLMGAICLIYVIGNVPQMVVMVVQNEALNNMFGFQVFRNVANTLEVLNHCLNFFIFCMASSEYTRAFLLNNCAIIRRCLLTVPCIERFINTRRANSLFSLFDQYDLQSTISEGGAVVNYKTDSTAAMRKHSVATMSTFNLSAQSQAAAAGDQLNAHGEVVRRKSASMCLPASPVFDAAVIEVCSTPPASSLGESPRFLSPIQPRHYGGGGGSKQAQSRASVCVSLLSGDKMSLSSLSGGQPALLTYRDNKMPQRRESMRPLAATVAVRAAANRSPSLYGSAAGGGLSKAAAKSDSAAALSTPDRASDNENEPRKDSDSGRVPSRPRINGTSRHSSSSESDDDSDCDEDRKSRTSGILATAGPNQQQQGSLLCEEKPRPHRPNIRRGRSVAAPSTPKKSPIHGSDEFL